MSTFSWLRSCSSKLKQSWGKVTRSKPLRIRGAAALAVKAYTSWREGRKLASHGELWEYLEVLASELCSWVVNVWNEAAAMHTCLYEGRCELAQVGAALVNVEKLVSEVTTWVNGARYR